MIRKLAEIVNHPYAAPVTETFKGIFKIARAPLNGFIEAVQKGWDDDQYRWRDARDTPKFVRVFKEIFDSYDMGPTMIGVLGALAGAGGLGTLGGFLGAGAGLGGIIAGAVAGVGLGVAAGPFALAGVIGLAAAAVGSVVGGVPGFFRGVSKIFEYHRDKEAYMQARQNLPAQTRGRDDVARQVAPVLADFNALAEEHKAPFVKMMNEKYAGVTRGRTEEIIKAIDALPDHARDSLAHALQEKLKLKFTPAAAKPDAPAPEPDDDRPIKAPRTASFRRHHQKTGVAA